MSALIQVSKPPWLMWIRDNRLLFPWYPGAEITFSKWSETLCYQRSVWKHFHDRKYFDECHFKKYFSDNFYSKYFPTWLECSELYVCWNHFQWCSTQTSDQGDPHHCYWTLFCPLEPGNILLSYSEIFWLKYFYLELTGQRGESSN